MRFTSQRELQQLYWDLEGLKYYPSIPYNEVVNDLNTRKIHIGELRVLCRLTQTQCALFLFYKYPNDCIYVEFKRED